MNIEVVSNNIRVGQVGCIWFRDFQVNLKLCQYFCKNTNVADFIKQNGG